MPRPKVPLAVLATFSLWASSACAPLADGPDRGSGVPAPKEANDPAFHDRLRTIAAGYEAYARVDDELHWAPFLCRQPQPSWARQSASGDENTHGRKLYYVFAKDRAAYLGRDGKTPSFVGQEVVKEAWEVQEVPATTPIDTTKSPVLYLKQDDRLYHAKQRAGLFVMFRLPETTPGTDRGWVYGTVLPDRTTITSSGTVGTCMSCHADAPKDRLFGMDYKGL